MRTFLFFVFFLFSLSLSAQVINLSYDKQRILLGEQVGVTVKAFVDKGVTLSAFPIDTLPHLEILESSKIDTTEVGETLQLLQTLIVTSWDSGRWNLPTVLTNGKESKSTALEVAFTSPWNPAQPYHDIKGIAPVEAPGRSTWWWYLVGLAVLIALFLLFFPKGKDEKKEAELDKNAYQRAMESLAKLEKAPPSEAKVFYTELVNIFRTYLKGAKGIQSFSKTTDDLSIQLQSQKLPAADYTPLVQTLRLSDLVKFAAYQPGREQNRDSATIIKQSITTIEQHHAV